MNLKYATRTYVCKSGLIFNNKFIIAINFSIVEVYQ